MKRVPLVAGNWKMNKTEAQAIALVRKVVQGLRGMQRVEVLLCPPATALSQLHKYLVSTDVQLGAQNIHWAESGAYTGEISPKMAAEFCRYVIIGHSERRAYFGEMDEVVNRKVKAALAHGLTPVICVGESLEENEAGRAAEVISRQVREGLRGAGIFSPEQLVVAYEPVWAIGTGRSATADGANEVIQGVIRLAVAGLFGEDTAQGMRVLYGGSVTEDNAVRFFSQPDIDGALVGGASLRPESFLGIVEAARG